MPGRNAAFVGQVADGGQRPRRSLVSWPHWKGQLVDVTPLHDDPKHQPISPGGDVLFLVDTSAQPIAVGVTVGPRPSRFYALDADERLVAYVRGLQDAEDEACRDLYTGVR